MQLFWYIIDGVTSYGGHYSLENKIPNTAPKRVFQCYHGYVIHRFYPQISSRILIHVSPNQFSTFRRCFLKTSRSFGIRGRDHKWFKSYLSGRSQSVLVDGHLSGPLPVGIGVPDFRPFFFFCSSLMIFQLSQSLVKQICMQMILK